MSRAVISPKKSIEFYDDHLRAEDVRRSLGQRYFQGILNVNPRKNVEAYVRCEGFTIDFRIDDEKMRNRSLHGDIVIVELLPEASWVPWSNMLQAKLGLSEKSGSSEDLSRDTAPYDNSGTQKLWAPNQDLIESFRIKTQPNGFAAGCRHNIEQRSLSIKLQPRARVVMILEARHTKRQVGTLHLHTQYTNALHDGEKLAVTERGAFFTSYDSRFPKMFVPRSALPEHFLNDPYNGLKCVYSANIASWPTRSRMPLVEEITSLGPCGDIETETEALLIQHGCNHPSYTEDVLEPLREILHGFGVHVGSNDSADIHTGSNSWRIPEEEIARRRDLRSCRIFTIDPPNAKDLDDALHIKALPDGTYEIGIHIADVSFFLPAGTALDAEVQRRATSVYLVQKVIPMLPSLLCEDICSLNPDVDRLAFSCIFRMNADGSLVPNSMPWFGKTVIRSCAKLDYLTAQRMIDSEIPNVPDIGDNPDAFLDALPEKVWEFHRRPTGGQAAWAVAQDVVTMHKLAMQRRQERYKCGALTIVNKKLMFSLDEKGVPKDTATYLILESNQMVEEYMLLANYLVAAELIAHFGENAFIRMCGDPDISGIAALRNVFSMLEQELDASSAKAVQDCLNRVSMAANPLALQIISHMLIGPMSEAQYRIAGIDPDQWRHYSLSIPYYTHFTSPIRRYADVVVHRQLEMIVRAREAGCVDLLQTTVSGGAIERLLVTADRCNEMRRSSKAAQERSDRVHFALYLLDKTCETTGYVVGIGEKSFSVYVPEFGVNERIFVDSMTGVESTWTSLTQTLQLCRTAEPSLNDKVVQNRRNACAQIFAGTMTLNLLVAVRVCLFTSRVPFNVHLEVLGPDESAPKFATV